jgi:hypothetical protein
MRSLCYFAGQFGVQGAFDKLSEDPPRSGPLSINRQDDILIFSKTREEHLVHVQMVLETPLHQQQQRDQAQTSSSPRPPSVSSAGWRSASSGTWIAGLQLVRKRSRLSPSGHSRPPAPTSADSLGWPTTTASSCSTFLALPPRRRSRPSAAACRPSAWFSWGPAEQRSFDGLRTALTSAPVIRVWDTSRPTRLLTYTSELEV